jgi:hypothetical protein
MSIVVPIKQVIPHTDSTFRNVVKMAHVLRKQGQIEPLQVQVYEPTGPTYITFQNDIHGAEIANAAKFLEWDTLLIVVVDRFQE